MKSTLTREEAINRHRIMWRWIGEESLRQKRALSKANAFVHFGWKPIYNTCWACEYAVQYMKDVGYKDMSKLCLYCPLEWPLGRCFRSYSILTGFLFDEFSYYLRLNDYINSSRVALQIAELKERW